MNLEWLDRAACHGARHYRSFMRSHPQFRMLLDQIEDHSGVGVRKSIATQLWTSIELESHARGDSPTLAAISLINHVPDMRRISSILPLEPMKHAPFWTTNLIPRIIKVNLRRMRR